jgi:hypothetical protein
MSTVLLLTVFLSTGEIIQSPGFEYESRESCEARVHKIERDWIGKPGIVGMRYQCIPVQTPEKWITKVQ